MSIIGTLPNAISNGDPLDAVPVMADFNWIVSQVNGNAAPLAGPSFTGTVSMAGLLDISGPGAGQIKFPAVQNSSANANTLDDYKENPAYAPALTATANCSALALSNSNYVKVGRFNMVHLDGTMTVTGTGTVLTFTFPLPSAEVGTQDFVGAAYYDQSGVYVGTVARNSAGVAQVQFPANQVLASGASKSFSATLVWMSAS